MNKATNCKHTKTKYLGIQITGTSLNYNLELHNCVNCGTTIAGKKIPKVPESNADKNNESKGDR